MAKVQPGSISPQAFTGLALQSASIAGPAAMEYLADPGGIRAIDPNRLRFALRLSARLSRAEAGLDDVPEALDAVGGPDALLHQMAANVPEAFASPELLDGPEGPVSIRMAEFTTETVDDWRSTASTVKDRIRATDLVREALGSAGVSTADKRALLALYRTTADYPLPPDLSAAEIAERLGPLMARALEAELDDLGAWPLPRDGFAGLYVRVLVALWRGLTAETPPHACATPGCLRTVPATRNRRYCADCQAARRRQSVRESRSRASRDGRSG